MSSANELDATTVVLLVVGAIIAIPMIVMALGFGGMMGYGGMMGRWNDERRRRVVAAVRSARPTTLPAGSPRGRLRSRPASGQ